jgi:hypothetical protein
MSRLLPGPVVEGAEALAPAAAAAR